MSLPSLFAAPPAAEPTVPPCAVCDAASTWKIWGDTFICIPCFTEWAEEPVFQGRKLDGATFDETCANFVRETAKWVQARKATR
jgi:hypothetical protein